MLGDPYEPTPNAAMIGKSATLLLLIGSLYVIGQAVLDFIPGLSELAIGVIMVSLTLLEFWQQWLDTPERAVSTHDRRGRLRRAISPR